MPLKLVKGPIVQSFRIGIHGRELSGKSWLALTAPRDPVLYLHNDERQRGTLDAEAFAHRNVTRCDYGEGIRGESPSDVQKVAQQRVAELQALANDASQWAGTIILDTETDLWTLYKYAFHGGEKADSKGGRRNNWAEINGVWRMFFSTLLSGRSDLIVISKDKPVYVDNEDTGRIVAKCSSEIPTLCEVRLEVERVDTNGASTFGAKVIKCNDVARLGEVFYDSNLPAIMESLYGRNVWEVKGD